MISVKEKLKGFDRNKEKINRQITSFTPLRNIYGSYPNLLSNNVKNGRVNIYQRDGSLNQKVYDQTGVILLLDYPEIANEVVKTLAESMYKTNHFYLSDVAAGLYAMAATGQDLYECEPAMIGDALYGIGLICSFDVLYKAACGPLVNKNGNAINGAGGIVRNVKEALEPYLKYEPTPRAYASFKNSLGGNVIVSGYPIQFVEVDYNKKAVMVVLSDKFFPGLFDNQTGKLNPQSIHVHRFAGQSAVLQYGGAIVQAGQGKRGKLPYTVKSMNNLINATQTGYELNFFIKGIVKTGVRGEPKEISIMRSAFKEIYPEAIKNGRPNLKKIKDLTRFTGDSLRAAIKETGIIKDLLKVKSRGGDPALLIPGGEAEGREVGIKPNLPNTAFIRVSRAIEG